MNTKTLAGEWVRLREARGLSQREIGRLTGLSNVTPWKIENGKTLRWETIHLMLKDGMRITPGSPEYELIHAAWLAEREVRADTRPDGFAKHHAEKHVLNAIGKFRRIIRGMEPGELDRFMGRVARIKRR